MMKQIRKEILEENETGKMCSLSVGEAGEMCSPVSADACGDGRISTKGGYVEILRFRHFARYMSFAPTGKQDKKKQILNG